MSKPFRIGRKTGKSVVIFDGDDEVARIKIVQLIPETEAVVIELKCHRGTNQYVYPVGQENGSEFVIRDAMNEPTSFVKINSITSQQVTLLFNVAQHITVRRQEIL